MADPTLFPDDLILQLKTLERRVRELESSNRLLSSAILGGTFQVLDAGGGRIAEIGSVYSGTSDGLLVYASDHTTLILDVDRAQGFASPWMSSAWADAAEAHTITSGSLASTWRTMTELMWSTQVVFRLFVTTDAATTGELQIGMGGSFSATKTVAPSTSGFLEFRWAHGLAIGVGPVFTDLYARRVSGAGSFQVFHPYPYHYGAQMGPVAGGWV